MTATDVGGLTPPGYLWSLLQMLGALLLVCSVAYVLLRGLRRVAGRRADHTNTVRVLERCPLSSRQSLWLVKVGEHCFLLGGNDSPGAPVTRLAELDFSSLGLAERSAGRSERGAGRIEKPSVSQRSFREILGTLRRHHQGSSRPPEES